ncbi:tyrosine--tRNA ligase [bacterium]|nr:tyrosine--tRNA ligase [bacterium]
MKINPQKIEQVLSRGVDKILPSKRALEALMKKRRIRVYLGIDPTAPRLHLGHTITLRKLQEFADLGEEAILVIGTGTVLTGDPSLRLSARPIITDEEIKRNIRTWKKQAGKVLDFSKVKIRYNGDWLLKLRYKDIVKIASHISAVKLFQRDMFQRRLKMGQTVWAHEILYPLFQGYDSVFLNVDLEIGGTDQTFNMLIGRELLAKMRKKEKFVLTCPMILGTDGRQMSKTSGNCIWLEDTPDQMYGKIMSIPDKLIPSYLELLTPLSLKEIKEIKKAKPREAKARLAREIVNYYHGKEAGQKAQEEFERIFRKRELPSRIPEVKINARQMNILELLVKAGLCSSKSQAKRLILQKGIKIDGKIQGDWKKTLQIKKGMLLQKGRRNFVRIK